MGYIEPRAVYRTSFALSYVASGFSLPSYVVLGFSRAVVSGFSRTDKASMDDHWTVTCPYCGEDVEIYVEPDVTGSFVQDCEVCCNPWRVQVVREGGDRYVSLGRADGSE